MTTTQLYKEINDYLNLLDFLYAEQKIVYGVDNTPLNIIKPKKFMNHLLYYADGKLTDKFFIKNVVTSPTFEKNNPLYCIGNINVGDYVSTSEIYGVAMKSENEETAFGKVISIESDLYNNDKNNNMDIKLINVEFL